MDSPYYVVETSGATAWKQPAVEVRVAGPSGYSERVGISGQNTPDGCKTVGELRAIAARRVAELTAASAA